MMKRKKGISLLEIMLALTVIAAILVGVFRFYNQAEYQRKINELTSQLTAIQTALNRWHVSFDNFDNLSMPTLIAQNFLPAGSDKSSWGGSITVKEFLSTTSAPSVTVTVAALPTGACQLVQRYFSVGSNGVTASQCQSAGATDRVASYIMVVQFQ